MRLHELKTVPSAFSAVKENIKKFEVRKNDRFFQVGDELLLKEFIPKDYWEHEGPMEDNFSGEILHRKITYVLQGGQYGVQKGYVVMGLDYV